MCLYVLISRPPILGHSRPKLPHSALITPTLQSYMALTLKYFPQACPQSLLIVADLLDMPLPSPPLALPDEQTPFRMTQDVWLSSFEARFNAKASCDQG